MLYGFLILIGFQLAGEFVTGVFQLSIPGPVLGMLFLFTALLIKGSVPPGLNEAGNGLLKYIGLLFVPAGAGISMFLGLIAEQWHVILIASVSSTILTFLISATLFKILEAKASHES
jgi:holin-like protein